MYSIHPDNLLIDTEIDCCYILRPVYFLRLVMAMRHSSIVFNKLDTSYARTFLPATVIGSNHPNTGCVVKVDSLPFSVILARYFEDRGREAICQMHLH